MRTMERYKNKLYYRNVLNFKENVDEDGFYTGETSATYGGMKIVKFNDNPFITTKLVEEYGLPNNTTKTLVLTRDECKIQDFNPSALTLFYKSKTDNIDLFDYEITNIIKSNEIVLIGLKERI